MQRTADVFLIAVPILSHCRSSRLALLRGMTRRSWTIHLQNGGPVYWTETPAYPHGGSANNYPLSKCCVRDQLAFMRSTHAISPVLTTSVLAMAFESRGRQVFDSGRGRPRVRFCNRCVSMCCVQRCSAIRKPCCLAVFAEWRGSFSRRYDPSQHAREGVLGSIADDPCVRLVVSCLPLSRCLATTSLLESFSSYLPFAL